MQSMKRAGPCTAASTLSYGTTASGPIWYSQIAFGVVGLRQETPQGRTNQRLAARETGKFGMQALVSFCRLPL